MSRISVDFKVHRHRFLFHLFSGGDSPSAVIAPLHHRSQFSVTSSTRTWPESGAPGCLAPAGGSTGCAEDAFERVLALLTYGRLFWKMLTGSRAGDAAGSSSASLVGPVLGECERPGVALPFNWEGLTAREVEIGRDESRLREAARRITPKVYLGP